jgi:hypothetical protein
MGDAVKVTVIATGIKSEKLGYSRPPSASMQAKTVQQSLRSAVQRRERQPFVDTPAPVPAPAPEPAPVPGPEALAEAALEDLEVPAYIRRRKAETP